MVVSTIISVLEGSRDGGAIIWTYIYHSKAFFAHNMRLYELKEKVDKLPKNAGSKELPKLFHIGPGSQ